MASRNKYIFTLCISQFVVLAMLGIFFYKLDQKTGVLKTTEIAFIISASIVTILSVIDIFIVLIRKKNLDKIVFKLEANDKYSKFYRSAPSILLIFGFLNIAANRSIYIISMSLIMISIALLFTVRGRVFPIGLSEKGLLFFGEIYKTDSITKCFIDSGNKELEFKINNSIFGSISTNSIVLKFPCISADNLIAFLNEKKISIEYK